MRARASCLLRSTRTSCQSVDRNVKTLNRTGPGSPDRTSRRDAGTACTSVSSAAFRGEHVGGGGGGGISEATPRFTTAGGCRWREEQEDDIDNDHDDDAVPRTPLRVVPVQSSQRGREKTEMEKSLGGPSRANSHVSPTLCQVVVWIDALYAMEGQCESFHGKTLGGSDESCSIGDALYLVLEYRCTQYRTEARGRHRGTWEVGRALRANDRQACGTDRQDERVEAWIFRETVTLNGATAGARGRGEEHGSEVVPPEDDHDHDHDLLLRVCVARSSGGSSSPSPPRRRAPVRRGTDNVESVQERVAAPDEVIGSATIPLGKCLAAADRDGARNCTFSRPVRVSVVNSEGIPIGWIELGVCGSG